KDRGLNLHSTAITLVRVEPDGVHGRFAGIAQVNGAAGYTFVVYVEDNGEPGALVDRFRIVVNGPGGFHYDSSAYATLGGLLDRGGNIQIHGAGGAAAPSPAAPLAASPGAGGGTTIVDAAPSSPDLTALYVYGTPGDD